MSGTYSAFNPGPYHLLAYGTLLGTNLFQTFVNGIVAFRALPRPMFSQLQKSIFPIYFSVQTALPVILVLTYPFSSSSASSISTVLFDPQYRFSSLLPMSIMFVTGFLNWAFIGPRTTSVMRERKHQETKDGKKYYDPGPHSEAMLSLNKRFGALHGISSLFNLVAVIASISYGFTLGARL